MVLDRQEAVRLAGIRPREHLRLRIPSEGLELHARAYVGHVRDRNHMMPHLAGRGDLAALVDAVEEVRLVELRPIMPLVRAPYRKLLL